MSGANIQKIVMNLKRKGDFSMALKETTKQLKDLLNHIVHDVEKADGGNKAAAQRVRTGTVKLEKVAKRYRKESITSERTTKPKRPAKAAKAKAKAKPKAAKSKRASLHARPFALKRPTAKVPVRRMRWS